MNRVKCLIIAIFGLPFFFSGCSGQTQTLPFPLPEIETNWNRIHITDVGSIDVPPSLKFVDEYNLLEINDSLIYNGSRLSLEPIKSGNIEKDLERYARVIIKTINGRANDYEKLNFNASSYSQSDITEVNNAFRQQTIPDLQKMGIEVVQWYPIKLEKINGMTTIHINYKYKQHDAVFIMHDYYFQNYDRMHSLSIAYAIDEETFWKPDLDKVIDNFRITNIK